MVERELRSGSQQMIVVLWERCGGREGRSSEDAKHLPGPKLAGAKNERVGDRVKREETRKVWAAFSIMYKRIEQRTSLPEKTTDRLWPETR